MVQAIENRSRIKGKVRSVRKYDEAPGDEEFRLVRVEIADVAPANAKVKSLLGSYRGGLIDVLAPAAAVQRLALKRGADFDAEVSLVRPGRTVLKSKD